MTRRRAWDMLWARCILLTWSTSRKLKHCLAGLLTSCLYEVCWRLRSDPTYAALTYNIRRLRGLLATSFLQTSIQTEGFRSLAEGEPVEYYLEAGDDGRTKAVQVTGPNGAPPQVSFQQTLHLSVPLCHLSMSFANQTTSYTCCDCTVRQQAMMKLSQIESCYCLL